MHRLFRPRVIQSSIFLLAFAVAMPLTAATIEYLDGTRIECKVLAKDETTVSIEVMSGGMLVKRTIPLTKVHKVIINDKTYVINEKPPAGATKDDGAAKTIDNAAKSSGAAKAKAAEEPTGRNGKATRSKAEVEALIKELGRKPPDWYEATPLSYPQTLDLTWPDGSPPGTWNNQKNVGQYIWDIINHNPSKWHEGVRLMHHLLTMHKDDAAKRVKIMNALGRMYHNLLQDDARAAFWWRQAGIDKTNSPPDNSVNLAECYWRLGNKQMAVDHLRKMNPVPYDAIKLWADMGETKQALSIAETAAKNGGQPHFAYIYAADACRVAGRYKEALDYYQKVLNVPAVGNKGQIERCHQRATASIEAIKLYDLSNVKKLADGKYKAEAIGYEGPVEVEVAVQAGRIEAVRVTQHKEKQFYAAMTDTPAKLIAKQGVKGIDATSSATITSEAIINATAKALASGAK